MGAFHKEVTIHKGLGRIVRHPRVKKKQHAGRTVDDMTVIEIREMPVGPAAGGEIVVRSSNCCVATLGAGWSGGAKQRIETRLRDSDGAAKGRVLYGELVCMNAPPTVVSSVCLHVQPGRRLLITGFDLTSDLVTHRGTLFDTMLLAVERVACECNDGRSAPIFIDVAKDEAAWYRDHFDFRQAGPHPYGKHRRLLRREVHGDCRPPKNGKAPRAAAQRAQTR